MITQESYELFDARFAMTMTFQEIDAKIESLAPNEASICEEVLCDEIFLSLCINYLTYDKMSFGEIRSADAYRILKKRVNHLPSHSFYDAYIAFVEGRKDSSKRQLHDFFQTYVTDPPPFGETDFASMLLAYKNGYDGLWRNVKQEIAAVPHDAIVLKLCDVAEAFYHADTAEDALEVMTDAYQKYPDSSIVNEMLALTYWDNKQYGNCIAAFERLYREESQTYDAQITSQDDVLFYLGFSSGKMKDRKAEIRYYERAIDLNPFCRFAANNLGYAYYQDKQYDKAYSLLKRCIEEKLTPDLTYPVANFARLLCAMGRFHEAKEFVKNAPANVPKAYRDKIAAAPDRDEPKKVIVPEPDSDAESEPAVKTVIERKGVQFQSEKLLEDELTMRMEAGMEVFGLPLKIYRRRGEYGRQYIFPQGRLDLLSEDMDGNLYIIELKKDSGYDDAYKQTVEYIEWFQKHKAKGKKVYGIICLNSPSKQLIAAVRKDKRVKLFEYRISYNEIT